eukprot:Pgem_evm3s1968
MQMISCKVPYFEEALNIILDVENGYYSILLNIDIYSKVYVLLNEDTIETVQRSAEQLYGLIHARFVLTSRGMALM